MSQLDLKIKVISSLSESYAQSITPKLKRVFQSELDTIWEVNADADLFLWYEHEKKYYLIRFPYGVYLSYG